MKRGLLLLVLSVLVGFTLQAQGQYNLGSHWMVIKGTSNLHDWQSNVTQVRGYGQMTSEPNVLKEIKSLYVEIPVKGIKSEKGSIMDGKTYDALKSGSYPQITYKLTKVTGLSAKGGGSFSVGTLGDLTIAGTTKQVDLWVSAKVDNYGSVSFSGSKKLKMTDFGIKPPTALLGSLTTGDEVEISFSVTLIKQ
ncbi:MAG: YceI family protein [Saprospiraceae bacterium]|nr:YceI family protein [Saprospiraceae bacterium]